MPFPSLALAAANRDRRARLPRVRTRFGTGVTELSPRFFFDPRPDRDPLVVARFKQLHRELKTYQCAFCGGVRHLDAHHVVPLAAGGEDHERNLVLLCEDDHLFAHRVTRLRRNHAVWTYEGPQTAIALLTTMEHARSRT